MSALESAAELVWAERHGGAGREWLTTNGLGGYASGTLFDVPTRRFHGYLVAALPAPFGRVMLLHELEERVSSGEAAPILLRAMPHSPLPTVPNGLFLLEAGLPRWRFEVDAETTLERTVVMRHLTNTVSVGYRLTRGSRPVRLDLRAWLDVRPHEGLLSPQQTRIYTAQTDPLAGLVVREDASGIAVHLRVSTAAGDATFTAAPADIHEVSYAIEASRGYDHLGSMHSPGEWSLMLEPGNHVWLTASAGPREDQPPPEIVWRDEQERRSELVRASHEALRGPVTQLLALAADQFVIQPATREPAAPGATGHGGLSRSVIAGYPWFTDWGRDTMISLEGLLLVTGRLGDARATLASFASHTRDGLIPNLFPEGERHGVYHTADATLWFFHALSRYERWSGDTALVAQLLPTLEDILAQHLRGTRFNIHADDDGLLSQGEDGYQLTWMDAKVDGWVVTPRRGKAVEINALWYNALRLGAQWCARAGRVAEATALNARADACYEAFNRRFWNPDAGWLFDVVDGEGGDDPACRPNQLLAISLPHAVLAPERWAAVLARVTETLATPYGLRTLDPGHPDYQPRYFGALRARDAAYHQGTVWPWLVGPFVEAWLKVDPQAADAARAYLDPLLAHLAHDGCLGSVSEIFDATAPYESRGCFAQAWSVAELARLIVLTGSRARDPETPVP